MGILKALSQIIEWHSKQPAKPAQPAPQPAYTGRCLIVWNSSTQTTTITSSAPALERFLREVAIREGFGVEDLGAGTIKVIGGSKDIWARIWPKELLNLVEYASVPLSPSNVVEAAKITRAQLEARPPQNVPVVPEQITKPRRIANPFSTDDMQGFSPGYEDKRKK